MAFHESYEAELQLNTLTSRGQWSQALTTINTWLDREPWRIDLLLRKVRILSAQQRFDQALQAIREYRTHRPDAQEAAFQEIELLLAVHHTAEALEVLRRLPVKIVESAQGEYYRGRILLARQNVDAGLQALWAAYQREPGFHRALIEWTGTAIHRQGKRRVRRQLEQLRVRHAGNPMIAISIGLAVTMIDSRYGQSILRQAVDRYPDYAPVVLRRRGTPANPADLAPQFQDAADAYRAVSEHILSGRIHQAMEAYYAAVKVDPSWLPVLAPLLAELLVDAHIRPEEARLLLEEALRQDPTNYRLHLSYTKVFLQLGFADEAVSSANCALQMTPESERAVILLHRAGAYALANLTERALADLRDALSRLPELKNVLHATPTLSRLEHDPRFRPLLGADHPAAPQSSWWDRFTRWIMGEQEWSQA